MGLIAKFKAALAARRILKEASKEITMDGQTKPGWQTTEFWGKTLVQGIVIYNALAKKDISPELGAQLVVGLEAVYVAGRSVVKLVKDIIATFKK
jgi:hypothetical protein